MDAAALLRWALFFFIAGRLVPFSDTKRVLRTVGNARFEAHIQSALNFLTKYETDGTYLFTNTTNADWDYNTNINDINREKSVRATVDAEGFVLKASENASKIMSLDLPPLLTRQLKMVRRNASPTNRTVVKLISELQTKMTSLYSKGKVCKMNATSLKCQYLELDPQLTEIMANSRDYEELLFAWTSWRDAVGPPIKPLYKKYVRLLNIGAREHTWSDYGYFWRSEYEMGPDFGKMTENLWKSLKPLYQELHAYARFKLKKKYNTRVSVSDPVPAHLFGDMWSQDWSNIFDILKPYVNASSLNVTSTMLKQNYTSKRMFQLAQAFFVSIGLYPMPPVFWNKSVFDKPADKKMVCHASAWDFNHGDARIKMCTSINQEDLLTVHHEMGHCEYYLAYKDQPLPFRGGANPGFHEAIGDTIALSVETPKYLKLVGLLYSWDDTEESDINFLMKQALKRVAPLPYNYLVDQWRWRVFSGNISANHYNSEWWKLRTHFQGVKPPVPRSENNFDPASKFHIGANVPYISYFISYILQFQFHQALCKLAKHSGSLHKCSIYKSKEAGERFKEMLQLGKSRPWPQALRILTGQRDIQTEAIREYFKPLQDWLIKYRYEKKYPIGWKDPEPSPPKDGSKNVESNARKTSEIGSVAEIKVLGHVNDINLKNLQIEKNINNEADPQAFDINTFNFAPVEGLNEIMKGPVAERKSAVVVKDTSDNKRPIFVPIKISPLNLGKRK